MQRVPTAALPIQIAFLRIMLVLLDALGIGVAVPALDHPITYRVVLPLSKCGAASSVNHLWHLVAVRVNVVLGALGATVLK